MIKIGVVGAAGKMGRTLVTHIHANPDLTLAAGIEQPGSSLIGSDAGELAGVGKLGVLIVDNLAEVAGELDVVIDFTIAPATVKNLEICLASGTAIVVGTTGLSASEKRRLQEIGKTIPIVFASNYSVGVNATFKLAEYAARIFGDSVDIEIIESHHRHKVDAPSGTALTLGEHIAATLDRNLESSAVYGRHGVTGARARETIGIHAVRAGDIVGEHTVIFAGTGERLEITHRAHSRDNFAAGALRAAAWVSGRNPGVYDMLDVLELNDY